MGRSLRIGAGMGVGTGLVAGLASVLGLGAVAPTFLDPWLPAALAVVAAHAAGGALLGALAGLVLGGRRERTTRNVARSVVVLAYGALVVAAAWLAGSAGPPATAAPHAAGGRVVVVGLDGGTWRVLDPLLAAGELPTFARLVREGASGVLMSIEPTFSSVVWTSIATGKVPAKHGIHSFYGLQNADLRAGRFWEVVAAGGEPVGVFQWLITWPPDRLPGFVVPGWLARDERTQPPHLEFLKRLEISFQRDRPLGPREAGEIGARLVREGLRFSTAVESGVGLARAWLAGDHRATYRAGKMAQLGINGDVFLAQYRRWSPRLAVAVFYGSDAIAHTYWKYHEPAAFPDVPAADVAAHGDALRDYYRRFDDFLARLLATCGDDTTVLLVSDHGFRAAEARKRAVSAEGLLALIGERERFHGQALNRRAYLLHRTPDAPEARADVGRAADKLRALRHGGEALLAVEVTGTHALNAELLDRTIDLDAVIETDSGSKPIRSMVTVTSWSGSHEPEGIILARGPSVRPGMRLVRASILDVAPTVLHLLGLPVAEDMDGEVLAEMLTGGPPVRLVATHDGAMPPRSAEVGAESDVTERLRALGYVR